jgi:hypothetical protein
MAVIDNEYVQKQCERLGNKANDIKNIADDAAAQAVAGNLEGSRALLVEAANKFRKLELRRTSVIDLITEILD